MSIGIPIKLLHEAEGHIISIELKSGEVYRGKLEEAEDNMNCTMTNITMTCRDGSTQPLDSAFIRGSHIKFLVLPDMLKNAPMFRKDLERPGKLKGTTIAATRGGRGGRGGAPGGAKRGRGAGPSMFPVLLLSYFVANIYQQRQ